jgi:hypothetical protein
MEVVGRRLRVEIVSGAVRFLLLIVILISASEDEDREITITIKRRRGLKIPFPQL